ncbi:MAG: CHRD domain-containing protein [Actinomycetota bacterium]
MRLRTVGAIALVLVGAVAVPTLADSGGSNLRADLGGAEEVPAVSTEAAGEFVARFIDDSTIEFSLTYSGLEAAPTQAHIHVGQPDVNGGISVWLCSNLDSPPTPAGVQACPASGTVTETIEPGDVVGPGPQGITAGEFDELVTMIRAGLAYANVHSTSFPTGEIRGQIR